MGNKKPNNKSKNNQTYSKNIERFFEAFEITRDGLKENDNSVVRESYQNDVDLIKNPGIKNRWQTVLDNKSDFGLEDYDYTLFRMHKREKVTRKYLPYIEKNLTSSNNREDILTGFIFSNALIMCGGYNRVDGYNHITTAAALWILDQLTLQGDIEKLFPILHDFWNIVDSKKIDELFAQFPHFNHPYYDNSLIMLVVPLVILRNEEVKRQSDESGQLQYDERDFNKEKPIRDLFDKVISLIDKKAIQNAVKEYESKVWEFYKLTLSAYYLVEEEGNRLTKRFEELSKLAGNYTEFDPNVASVLNMSSKSSNWQKDDNFNMPNVVESNKKNEYIKAAKLAEIELKEFEWDIQNSVLNNFGNVALREKYAKKCSGFLPQKLVDDIISFSVKDPFESSFALLYLLDTNSDIPWLYYGSLSVAYTIDDQLPFNIDTITSEQQFKKIGYSELLYQHRFPGSRYEGETDADGDIVERDFAINLSQKLYKVTRTVFPRILHRDSFLPDDCSDVKNEEVYADLLKEFMFESLYKRNDFSDYMYKAFDDEQETESDDEELSIEEYKRKLDSYKKQIKSLKKELSQGTKENKFLSKQNEQYEELTSSLRKELSDLREIVFNRDNEINEDETGTEQYSFPYHTDGKIVSFGGHQSWLNSMRDMLPDITFVSPDTLPNEEIIKNADTVWIQPNCISHAYFYRIVNIVRLYNIQLRYFKYQGTIKCANQLAESYEKE